MAITRGSPSSKSPLKDASSPKGIVTDASPKLVRRNRSRSGSRSRRSKGTPVSQESSPMPVRRSTRRSSRTSLAEQKIETEPMDLNNNQEQEPIKPTVVKKSWKEFLNIRFENPISSYLKRNPFIDFLAFFVLLVAVLFACWNFGVHHSVQRGLVYIQENVQKMINKVKANQNLL